MTERSEDEEVVEERPKDVPAKHSTAKDPDREGDTDAVVEEASKDSYPASDPPAW